ncbi:potassium transporter TrkA [Mycobacterium sp. CBMA293]|uniref:NAD-binding protein n=1 Tax=unclassified Mycolicibacterium TaxID=2636767 RepID=UPI0012DEFE05|nr:MULTISPECIES: NAD-binding protein [unclassified Mycolicibacterium]MUL48898.1 potassium transporter TrkA [Mycolicibacterium sp. CBMA 360]MUL62509.1 potassium transporter TrkA [Mycolicibacterium sp. CBMA 335]MUL74200.1 potassium transporter TrkA [Mycolicibacterium sp. CBMA 311]MUL96894.1 potassium transporter TrkA [Mycolicibacterium sp. CBMA 230]MUM03941.1 potassium transporter TrkA [Mycolicibacterium sp. CBMA 213]
MRGHVIVCGTDALANRITEGLQAAGAVVVTIHDPTGMKAAIIASATAIVCVSEDDAVNLEIALLARELNPTVRVVARLANSVLRAAVAEDNGPGAVLDVADLAALSVVEACLARTTHTVAAAGVDFVISGTEAPHDATLREMFGDLAPVAVIRGENSDQHGEVIPCPGRDFEVRSGDWTAMVGTADELASAGISVPRPLTSRTRRPWPRHVLDTLRVIRDDINPAFWWALSASTTLLLGSTVLLRFAYHNPHGMSWIDALYFSTETIATVGYGDFSFLQQPTWLRLWGIGLMFAGVTTTAILVAFTADALLSRRLGQSSGRRRVQHLRNHIVVVGLGSFGIRVVSDLAAAGYDVAVIERDESNRFLSQAAQLDVPVIFGDATLRQTLELAGLDKARAVAVLTADDMVNIETGIVLREILSSRLLPEIVRPDVPLVLRIYDRTLGAAVAQRFGFANVRSTVELAAPWFIGAAMGLQVLGTFSVGQQSFTVGGVHVDAGSTLDGMRMGDVPTQTRVIAITRGGTTHRRPRRETRLSAGDTAYLVGPYRELIETLLTGQRPT